MVLFNFFWHGYLIMFYVKIVLMLVKNYGFNTPKNGFDKKKNYAEN